MPHMSRREREQAEHRRQILEAAESVFSRKGYYEATVQEIAALAEFSVGYLYGFFSSKADLFSELVDMRVAQFVEEALRRIDSAPDPIEKVRAAIRWKLEFFRTHRGFFLIFTHFVAGERPEAPVVLTPKPRERYKAYLQHLASVLREGMQNGRFKRLDPLAAALCMEGMSNGLIAYWVHTGGRAEGLPGAELLEQVYLEGILASEARS